MEKKKPRKGKAKGTAMYHVGVLQGGDREVFKHHNPTQATHGQYVYSIGPFNTAAGAHFMAERGEGNPHVPTTGHADRLAKKLGYRGPKYKCNSDYCNGKAHQKGGYCATWIREGAREQNEAKWAK